MCLKTQPSKFRVFCLWTSQQKRCPYQACKPSAFCYTILVAFKLDVYACGIIFSELNNPESALYAGMSKFAIMQAVLHENLRPTLPASEVCVFPDAGVELLRRMWDKDPGTVLKLAI